jgi:hypothetical protein
MLHNSEFRMTHDFNGFGVVSNKMETSFGCYLIRVRFWMDLVLRLLVFFFLNKTKA